MHLGMACEHSHATAPKSTNTVPVENEKNFRTKPMADSLSKKFGQDDPHDGSSYPWNHEDTTARGRMRSRLKHHTGFAGPSRYWPWPRRILLQQTPPCCMHP